MTWKITNKLNVKISFKILILWKNFYLIFSLKVIKNLVPDISNVEHIEDETINLNRVNKLVNIKNKYLNGKDKFFLKLNFS